MRVLVAGASGHLGRHLVERLLARGATVRVLGRTPERLRFAAPLGAESHVGDALRPRRIAGAATDCDVVVSSLGASVHPGLGGYRGYPSVDTVANRNLIAEAERAGVRRFVYVSLVSAPAMRELAYVRAHEQVVQALQDSRLEAVVVRPTGFFSAFGAFLDMARRGPGLLFGDGATRSNPIDDRDVAEVCVEALDGPPREIPCGGPDVLTRREVFDLAFAALGKPVRIRRMSPAMGRTIAGVLRPLHPRMSQLFSFVVALAEHDVVADVRGRRRLADHYREAVAAAGSNRPPAEV